MDVENELTNLQAVFFDGAKSGARVEREQILKLIDETDSIPCPFCGGENSDCTTCHGTDDVRVFNYDVLKQKIEEGK